MLTISNRSDLYLNKRHLFRSFTLKSENEIPEELEIVSSIISTSKSLKNFKSSYSSLNEQLHACNTDNFCNFLLDGIAKASSSNNEIFTQNLPRSNGANFNVIADHIFQSMEKQYQPQNKPAGIVLFSTETFLNTFLSGAPREGIIASDGRSIDFILVHKKDNYSTACFSAFANYQGVVGVAHYLCSGLVKVETQKNTDFVIRASQALDLSAAFVTKITNL